MILKMNIKIKWYTNNGHKHRNYYERHYEELKVNAILIIQEQIWKNQKITKGKLYCPIYEGNNEFLYEGEWEFINDS